MKTITKNFFRLFVVALALGSNLTVTAQCNVTMSHTVGSNGWVYFSSAGGSTNTAYGWYFGNGYYSTLPNPSVQYSSAGTHTVTLYWMDTLNVCNDTIVQAINITGIPCVANASFSLVSRGIPGLWDAIPAYPYNVVSATWSWGDGTFTTGSNGLYISHQYSVAGTYQICLQVTTSCGLTASTCASYYVSKNSNAMISVNTVPPPDELFTGSNPLGLVAINKQSMKVRLYPNPGNGQFTIQANDLSSGTPVNITNIAGELVYHELWNTAPGTNEMAIRLNNIAGGVYFVKIGSGDNLYVEKIVVNK